MNKVSITALLAWIILPAVIFAQASSIEISKKIYVVSSESVSVLEAGTDNVLQVKVHDQSVERLLVNSSQGTVRQDGKDFIIHPDKAGEIVLKIYNYNDLSHPVLIEERKMEVAFPPFAILAGKSGGKITREELLNASKVEISGSEEAMKVCAFKLSVSDHINGYTEFSGSNENITAEMNAALHEITVGSKVYVEYIRAGRTNEDCGRQFPPLSFIVSE
jgi:hypothetical protein